MNKGPAWDQRYEWKAVLLLSVGFGLVNVDRFMIMPLFPTIMKEFKLSYSDLGLITGALAFAWGAAALLMGNLSDRLGQRKVIIGSLVTFSILVGASGLATGLMGLVLVRVFMGFADGAYTPTSISATVMASKPSRHGFNVGIQQLMAPLLGLAITPLVVTQLLSVMEWRWVFVLLTVPGLLLAVAMFFVLRDPEKPAPSSQPANVVAHRGASDGANIMSRWGQVLRHRNPKILIVGMLCWLTCLIVITALLPSYLTEHLHLSITQMGFVLSALGFGGTVGCLILPAISDRIGRKPVMLLSALGALAFLFLMTRFGGTPVQLFGYLFMTSVFNSTLITLTVGPISAESVPASLMATSSGMVIGIGEVFGGGAAPILAGVVAQNYGLETVLYVAMAALAVGFLAMFLLTETAPGRNKLQRGSGLVEELQ